MHSCEQPRSPTQGCPPSRRRYVLVLGVCGLGFLGGTYALVNWLGRDALTAAEAEADQLDPGWKMDELERKRALHPAATNSATVVSMVSQMLLRDELPFWDPQRNNEYSETWLRRLSRLEPLEPLPAVDVKALRAELKRFGTAVDEARKLAERPQGRYPVPSTTDLDAISAISLAHLSDVMRVVQLLCYDALLLVEEQELRSALGSCRAALNAARSIGDEPWYWSMRTRLEMRWPVLQVLQRVLAQGVPPADELAQVQALLEDEERQPLPLIAARARRAYEYWRLREGSRSRWTGALTGPPTGGQFRAWLDSLRQGEKARAHEAAVLRFYNQVVEVAKLPAEEQRQHLPRLETAKAGLAQELGWSLTEIANEFHTALAELRGAIVAVALERFRQDHHRWPHSLDELAPAYLAAVPRDLFDGKPLRYRRSPGGVVVYSVGPDGQDNQGDLPLGLDDVLKRPPGTDVGWELWEVHHRRQRP